MLTINLDAIRANYRALRQRLGATTCAAVVKADGYGLGAAEVARALRREGCDHFFVAHAEEGIALRSVLGREPAIYVLNGMHPGAELDGARAGLIAVANSAAQLAAWRGAARKISRRLPVAVQVDSGMSRLGMSAGEVEAVAADGHAFRGLELSLVLSHLACADEPAHAANTAQRDRFDRFRALLPSAPASLANSSGIFLGPGFHYDLARPGAALYGINPTPGRPNPMRQVVGLEAKVIQLRDIEADAGVGYGHAFRAKGPLRAATIALGYADGWPRGATTAAFLGDIRLPIIGRVSMDSIVLDVSALPVGKLRAGSLVRLIGTHQSIDALGEAAGTIGYEILTRLGNRFERVYLRG